MSFTVAMVVPTSGPSGIYGASSQAATEFAVHALNGSGGILGERIRIQWVDGGLPLSQIRHQIDALTTNRSVDAVTGWHISAVRNAIAPVINRRVPYLYPALYEGDENRSGVYCTGERPFDSLVPALRLLRRTNGVSRWFVVGDAYEWPQHTFEVLQGANLDGITVTGVSFLDYYMQGQGDVERTIAMIEASQSDGVLVMMIGQNAVRFNRAFGASGLDRRVIRLCPLTDENMLLADGAENNIGLFTVAGYFRTLTTDGAMQLGSDYEHFHSTIAPPLSSPAESCIEALTALSRMTEAAHSARVSDLDRVIDGLRYVGPRGGVMFKNNQAQQHVYLAQADGLEYNVVDEIQ